jgi:hypothetical protein
VFFFFIKGKQAGRGGGTKCAGKKIKEIEKKST